MKSFFSLISKAALLTVGALPLFGLQAKQADYEEAAAGCGCCESCCHANDPCANCAQLWPSRGPNWIVTPNAGPCVASGCDFFVTADFIYWTIRQDNLGFAFTNESSSTATNLASSDDTKRGKVIHPDWRMEPGFKAGLGWIGCGDGWDLYLNYTWLRTRKTRETVKAPSSGSDDERIINDLNWVPQATGTNGAAFRAIEEISGKWRYNFNVLDLELGRNFFVSKCLHLRPHFGFKGSWRKQKMTVRANGESTSSSTILLLAASENKISNWGFGPRAGLDSAWHFNPCFSIVGKAAISALWGKFNVTGKEYQKNCNAESNPYTVYNNIKNDPHTIKPVLELFMGLRWEDWFCCDSYHYGIDIGWEEQWWSNENRFFSYEPLIVVNNGDNRSRIIESRLGDLFMQGLTVKLRFDF